MGICGACLRRAPKTYPEEGLPASAVMVTPTSPYPQDEKEGDKNDNQTPTCYQDVEEEDENNDESSSDTDQSCPGEPMEAKWARAAKRQRKLARERRRAAKTNAALAPADFASPAPDCVVSSFAALPRLDAQLAKDGCFDRQCFLLASRGAVNDVYDLSITLGKGTFGSVERGTHRHTGALLAIKTIPKKKIYDSSQLAREVDIIRLLEHPNILKMFESFEDSKNIYIVMELCGGGELFDHIPREAKHGLPEFTVAHLMRQVSGAVFYMHQQQVAHRDLKPENFLLAQSTEDLQTAHVKVIDFGFSTRFKPGSFMKTMASTPHYVAPEVIAGQYTHACDVWSLGVVLYVLLSGATPFFGTSNQEVLSKVTTGTYDFEKPACWCDVASISKELIKNILVTDPTLRPSAKCILEHPFLKRQPSQEQSREETSLRMSLVWQRLESFGKLRKVRKAVLTALAQQLGDKSVEQLRMLFDMLDTDGDGVLSLQELQRLQGSDQVSGPPANAISLTFDSIDTDGSGAVEYIEFLAAAIDWDQHVDHSSSHAVFRVFDLDGDGKVSKDELATLLSCGLTCTLQTCSSDLCEDIEATMQDADHDDDGCLNFEEFESLLRKSCTRNSFSA